MEQTKPLLTALIALLLAQGCLTPSDSSSPTVGAVNANQPVTPDVPTTPETPAPAPTPTPLSFASIQGKVLSYSSETLEFQESKVIDTRCGAEYTIASQSSNGTEVIIETDVIPSTYQPPSTTDCLIPLQGLTKASIINYTLMTCATGVLSDEIAWQIRYKITEHGGAYSVERIGRSRVFVGNCQAGINQTYWHRVEYQMPAEVYQ